MSHTATPTWSTAAPATGAPRATVTVEGQRPVRRAPARLRHGRECVSRAEGGSALVELTWLGLLLLIPLVYVVATLATVQRSAYGATEAARAAGRAFILSPDVVTARTRAFDAARVAMLDQGVPLAPDDLAIDCAPTPESCLQPGSTVRVTIAVDVRLPLVPRLWGHAVAAIAVDASHTEPFGTYREAAP